MLLLLAVMLLIPVTAQAAAPSKTAVKKLYKEFLESNTSHKWFRVLDINQDGVNELVTAKDVKQGSRKYTRYYIYTIKDKKVKYVGYTEEEYQAKKAIYYNKNLKAIRMEKSMGPRNGTSWLYKVYKYKLQERLMLSANYGQYSVFVKSIYGKPGGYFKTREEFEKYYNTYMVKGCTKYALYSNTKTNRANQL